MFSYIKGNAVETEEDFVIIDNNDIGYKIFTSNWSVTDIRNNTGKITMYTYLVHREDDMCIYGFSSKKELKVFQLLISVSGVGSKLALGILSSIPYENLLVMITSEDINSLTKAQGIGKKTAQRLVLELKEKIGKSLEVKKDKLITNNLFSPDIDEAVEALISLGYGKIEAEEATKKVNEEGLSIEATIRKALKYLAK